MPSIAENRQVWNETYNWEQGGNEWSCAWGGVDMQWHAVILPRIHTFVPCRTILEIAPGFGRWTQFLKGAAARLILVDMSQKCIQACQERFRGQPNLEYHVNDGRSLSFIPPGSVHFVFSFDSLVHAEDEVIEAYLLEIERVLAPEGIGFIHHSNYAEYAAYIARIRKIPGAVRGLLARAGLIEMLESQWRATSMSATKFRRHAEQAGLQCISQELVNWSSQRLIDCFSVFARPTSRWARPNRPLRNPDFMPDTKRVSSLQTDPLPNHQAGAGGASPGAPAGTGQRVVHDTVASGTQGIHR